MILSATSNSACWSKRSEAMLLGDFIQAGPGEEKEELANVVMSAAEARRMGNSKQRGESVVVVQVGV